jgi:hypothetical protein
MIIIKLFSGAAYSGKPLKFEADLDTNVNILLATEKRASSEEPTELFRHHNNQTHSLRKLTN